MCNRYRYRLEHARVTLSCVHLIPCSLVCITQLRYKRETYWKDGDDSTEVKMVSETRQCIYCLPVDGQAQLFVPRK